VKAYVRRPYGRGILKILAADAAACGRGRGLDDRTSARRSAGGARSPEALLGPAEYRSLGEFRRAIREFLAFSEEGAREQGLTSQQHQALLAIKSHAGSEPMTIGELAASLLIKNHSAVGLVARLVERDLVTRRESDVDRRRVVIELRPRGEQALETISIRNLGQLNRTAEILAGILDTVRRLEQSGAWSD